MLFEIPEGKRRLGILEDDIKINEIGLIWLWIESSGGGLVNNRRCL
jgi:hypothetical protein